MVGTAIAQTGTPEQPSERVLSAVADVEGTDPVDLDTPLYEVIDPDALDALFASDAMVGSVTFTYLDYEITVRSDGDTKIVHSDG